MGLSEVKKYQGLPLRVPFVSFGSSLYLVLPSLSLTIFPLSSSSGTPSSISLKKYLPCCFLVGPQLKPWSLASISFSSIINHLVSPKCCISTKMKFFLANFSLSSLFLARINPPRPKLMTMNIIMNAVMMIW